MGSNDLYQGIQLTYLIISGTGELASLKGELSKTGIIKDDGPVGTYTGRINSISNPTVEVEPSDEY